MNLQQALEATVKKIRTTDHSDMQKRLLAAETKDFAVTMNLIIESDSRYTHESEELLITKNLKVKSVFSDSVIHEYNILEDIQMVAHYNASSKERKVTSDFNKKDYLLAA